MDSSTTTFTGRRLCGVLASTALPVLLTTGAMRVLHASGVLTAIEERVGPACTSLAAYALANWLAFALVYASAGRQRLRRHGLRVVVDARRLGASAAAFVAGLAVYGVVAAIAGMIGMPPMRGMDYG